MQLVSLVSLNLRFATKVGAVLQTRNTGLVFGAGRGDSEIRMGW